MKIPDRVIVVSDSRSRTDVRCRRERFYSTEYGGHGITSAQGGAPLELGIVVHDAITTAIIERRPAKTAAAEAQAKMEKSVKDNMMQGDEAFDLPVMAAAMVYGFLTRVWPGYAEAYDIVIVEDACTWTGPAGIVWYARPDILLRRKVDDTLWYLELKTTGLDPSRFCRIWGHKTQMHLGARCVEATIGEPVEGVIVQGLWKGTKYKGATRSKMLGGYCRQAIGAVGKTVWRVEHAGGFTYRTALEYDGGITAWIDALPNEVVAEYFPCTPPITPDPEYLDNYVAQRTYRETEIAQWHADMDELERAVEAGVITEEVYEARFNQSLNEVWPQENNACENEMTGFRCSFYEVCWSRMVNRDPIGSGLFKLRESPLVQIQKNLEANKEGGNQ
jgi:hypothetical protein